MGGHPACHFRGTSGAPSVLLGGAGKRMAGVWQAYGKRMADAHADAAGDATHRSVAMTFHLDATREGSR